MNQKGLQNVNRIDTCASVQKRRFYSVVICLVVGCGLYMAAYFLCVDSPRFAHSPAVMEESLESAGVHYRVSPRLEHAALYLFGPAHFLDANLFRPQLWKERQVIKVKTPE